MARVDVRERAVALKLVYCGPPMSGKTTNLRELHARIRDPVGGRLTELGDRAARTVVLDLLPMVVDAAGVTVTLRVYTVPGQPGHDAARRAVLRGTDGLAFVADSARAHTGDNACAYERLEADLRRVDLDPRKVPLVVQHNKTDLPGASAPEPLGADARDPPPPEVPASAIAGQGVVETLCSLVEATWAEVAARHDVEDALRVGAADVAAAVRQHVGAGGRPA